MKRQHVAILALAVVIGVAGAFGAAALQSSGAPATTAGSSDDPGTATSTPGSSTTATPTPTQAQTASPDDEDSDSEPYTRVIGQGPPEDEGGNGTEIRLEAGPEQTVRGETTLEAGTELRVRLRSTGETPTKFIKSQATTVTETGTFRTTYNVSGIEPGTAFEVTVRGEETVLANATGQVLPPTNSTRLQYDGDRLSVDAASNQTIAGTTTAPAGTNVTIRLHSEGAGGTMFIKTDTVAVDEKGRFSTAFNFSGVQEGTTFRASVLMDDTRVDYAPGRVG